MPAMKIDLDTYKERQYRIDAYQAGSIIVNGDRHTRSVIVSPGKVISDWPPGSFADLASQHIDQIIELQPEIIILGTGSQLYFPAPELISRIFELNIGFEAMDTGAACRCYNLLVSEQRNVAAALIMLKE